MKLKRQLGANTAIWISAVACLATGTSPAHSQNTSGEAFQIEEIKITARRREESLQDVPDAVTAITAGTIEHAGIRQIGDFMSLVPNLTFRDGSAFRKGDIKISMRGISNGQEGWAPVTFVVDGVPASSLDAINSGSLEDVERIEVLRGPQSALYGAGAIAGAINIITRQPTNEFAVRANAAYAKGNDKRLDAAVSGPLVQDKLLFQVHGGWRDSDGLIDSATNGLDLDFEKQWKLGGRLIFRPQDDLEFDLRARYLREENGSTYQDAIIDPDLFEVFNDRTAARRGFAGEDDRKLLNLSFKIDWQVGAGSIISVTGYDKIDQEVNSSLCYDDPDDPLFDADPASPGDQTACLLGVVHGSMAQPGQPIDELFNSLDNFTTFTQDIRYESDSASRLRWLIGGSFLHRKSLTGFDASLIIAPDGEILTLFPAWNEKKDTWWGVYAQVSWDVTDQLELTVAGRYDDNEYKNTSYTDRSRTTIIQVPDPDGSLVSSQVEEKNAFQPKVQVSYNFSREMMVYATWSKGFRAGFFNTGSFTLPERTWNYEAGLKATLFGGRMIANAAVFHIDYSDQQFSTVINMPPFRVPVTIPKTKIDGVELETTLLANRYLTLSGALGYLDSRLEDGTRSPIAPEWTGNLAADLVYPLVGEWDVRFRGDYRYTSPLYLGRDETSRVSAKDYVDLRIGVENDQWRITGFGRNLTNTREPVTELVLLTGKYVRAQNRPRSYGIEISYRY